MTHIPSSIYQWHNIERQGVQNLHPLKNYRYIVSYTTKRNGLYSILFNINKAFKINIIFINRKHCDKTRTE